jgi:hypothetical protein
MLNIGCVSQGTSFYMPNSICVGSFQDLNTSIGDIHNLIMMSIIRRPFHLHMQFSTLDVNTLVKKIDTIVPMWIPF